jgi:aspartate racemase
MLINQLNGSDQDIPTIVSINDGSIPDRSSFILLKSQNPVPIMQRNLRLLEKLGANIICIPCNTAHIPIIFDKLKTRKSTIINMPREVVKVVEELSLKKVFILGTAGTLASKTYQNLCEDYSINYCVPKRSGQILVDQIIKYIKAGKTEPASKVAYKISRMIEQSGSDGVILGCTELGLIAESLVPQGSVSIDTLDVLARSCISYTKKEIYRG